MTALDRSSGLVRKEVITELLYGDDPNGGPEEPLNSIKIFVLKLRRKIRKGRFPVRVDTIWGQGWQSTSTEEGKDHRSALRSLAAVVIFSLLFLHPVLALAQWFCSDRDKLVYGIENEFGEERVSIAWTTTGQIIERYEHPVTKAWTLTIYPINSQACIVSHGDRWYDSDPEAREPHA